MAHPFNDIRQHKVEHARVPHITRGYASGGGIAPHETNKPIGKKASAHRDAQAVEGGAAKERQDRPGRARGGRAPKAKHKGTNVNVIVAPQGGGAAAHAPLPMPGVAGPGGPPPAASPMMPPRPPMAPPMAGAPGAPMPPPGLPPRHSGGRTYATGGAVKSGPAFDEGRRNGTQMQNNPAGKNDQNEVGRGKPISYKTGGAIYSPAKGGMGPKFPGGSGGGQARVLKQERAARTYARAK